MAIKGFEDVTRELTAFELEKLVPLLQRHMSKCKGKENAVKNAQLRQFIFDRVGKRVSEPRIRKIAEYLRQSHMVDCLIAGRNGYFIATTPEEINEWLETMKQRRNALNASISAGKRSKKRMTRSLQPTQFRIAFDPFS